MLLSDADVEETSGVALLESGQPGRFGHGGGNSDDTIIQIGEGNERVGEGGGKRFGHRLVVVHGRTQLVIVHLQLVGSRRFVPTTLFGENVHDDRSVPQGCVTQSGFDRFNVVTVDGPDVAHAQILEEGAGRHQFTYRRRDPMETGQSRASGAREMRREVTNAFAHRDIGAIQSQRRE